MRPRISLRGSVRPYVRPSVRPSVCPSVNNYAKPPKKQKKRVVNTLWSFDDPLRTPGLVVFKSRIFPQLSRCTFIKKKHTRARARAVSHARPSEVSCKSDAFIFFFGFFSSPMALGHSHRRKHSMFAQKAIGPHPLFFSFLFLSFFSATTYDLSLSLLHHSWKAIERGEKLAPGTSIFFFLSQNGARSDWSVDFGENRLIGPF